MGDNGSSHDHHVCPVWVGYLLAGPFRKLFQDPGKILSRHVTPGMCVLDIGCAMGFFSLPMAKMVGPNGRVICVDLQQKMLDVCLRRARRKGLGDRVGVRRCEPDSLCVADLTERVDFALAFAVVHEVPDRSKFFSELHAALRPGARVLVAEPQGRVSLPSFEMTVSAAKKRDFVVVDGPGIRRSYAVILEKQRRHFY